MKLTYQTYCAQMRGLRHTPMSEEQFNKMEGIEPEKVIEPLQIRPKNQRAMDATHENFVKDEK